MKPLLDFLVTAGPDIMNCNCFVPWLTFSDSYWNPLFLYQMSARPFVYAYTVCVCVCVCVTFLLLPAASCSLPGAEQEPPPVLREGEVLGYERTQCHCVRSARLLASTQCAVSATGPHTSTSITSISAAPVSNLLISCPSASCCLMPLIQTLVVFFYSVKMRFKKDHPIQTGFSSL